MDVGRVRVLQLHTLAEIRAELVKVGADSSLEEKLARAEFYILKMERVTLPLARYLYQELVIEGGQVVTAPRLEHVGAGDTDVLLCATRYQFKHLLVRLRWQPSEELHLVAEQIENALAHVAATPPALEWREARWDWQRTYVMGILNLTPDSFSGDGLLLAGDTAAQWTARAVERARVLIDGGADILDVGGESTRPGATPVDEATELERVLPVVRALAELRVRLSIDTSKARVADAALRAGAVMVNDVTGLRGDGEMARVVAAHGAALVLMHAHAPDAQARDFLAAMLNDLDAQLEAAARAGIAAARIVIDPGLGFGKTAAQQLEILNRLNEFRVFGCAVLIGPSRKGFISRATGVSVQEREAGTAAAVALGITRGANLVRVHNVDMMTRVAKMADAILHVRTVAV